jgi:hypothetical protein
MGIFPHAAGDFKKKRSHDDSLVISRTNFTLGGKETFIPPRLLYGTVPTALLEAFHMWQGEDDIIRGSPIEEGSQWFNYYVEIYLNSKEPSYLNEENNLTATIVRRPIHMGFTKIKSAQGQKVASALLRDSGLRLNTEIEDKQKEYMEAAVMQLSTLGYPPSVCRLALRKCDNDLDMAAAWMLDESNLQEMMAAAMIEEQGAISMPGITSTSESTGYLSILQEEGFSPSAAQYALELNGNDLALAKAWLLDPANKDQINMLNETHEVSQMEVETEQSTQSTLRSSLRSSTSLRRSMTMPMDQTAADLKLQNLMETTENLASNQRSMLYRLATVLTRLEDASHILVWSSPHHDPKAEDTTELGFISVIELPRLKVKFQPRQEEDGRVLLYLLDHEGWFLSDSFAQLNNSENAMEISDRHPPGTNFLKSQLMGIENCLVLENHSRELQVMIANHDITRPRIMGEPFASKLIFDRSSLGWQQVMTVRYFLYPVHTSRTFLLPQTLSSTLYLLLLRFFNRYYYILHT